MTGEEYVSYSDYLLIQRERDEARSELSLKQQTLTIAEGTLSDLRKQRDEWSAMCGRYKQERDEVKEKYRWAVIHWQIGAAKMERERDDAREKLENEMKWHHRTHTELVQTQCKLLDMQMGRDEVQEKYDNLATEHMLVVNKLCEERDEAREQVNRYRYNLDLLPIKWDI
jgi:chromosome segregation ATPase